LIQCS